MTETSAEWQGDPIRLDQALPELRLARSRNRAAELIAAGSVRVDGEIAEKPGLRVRAGSKILVSDSDHYVSRGAHKLIAGLDLFGVDPSGRLALDLGASTGGFTQVLLERGADHVLAIDVGHDQMAASLADDDRVTLVEGVNARELTAARLVELTGITEQPNLVVADLSFISLTLILPAIARTAAPHAELVLLIKPQFEVGRTGIREGIVVDPKLREAAIERVLESAHSAGYIATQLQPSPIEGGRGNREFLAHFVPESRTDQTQWNGNIGALCSDTGAR